MNNEFVTFGITKKLKEKGFRKECFARYYCSDKAYFERNSYNPDTESVFYCYNDDEDLGRFYIDAPTIFQVLKWLREEKKRYLGVTYVPKMVNEKGELSKDFYFYTIQNIGIFKPMNFGNTNNYKSYEEAAIAGIEYCLDNLI